MKLIRELLAEATERCVTCDGRGWHDRFGGNTWCVDCRGTGAMLTDGGHELVKFLTTWLKGRFADEDHGHSLH